MAAAPKTDEDSLAEITRALATALERHDAAVGEAEHRATAP